MKAHAGSGSSLVGDCMLNMIALFRYWPGGRLVPRTVVQKLIVAFQRGCIKWHSKRWSMLSVWLLHSLHDCGPVGSLLRTKVARWTSFLHCLSSVGSESGVPKDWNTCVKGMLLPKRVVQLVMQLGLALAVKKEVRYLVMWWMVRSESLRGWSATVGLSCFMCHPVLRGKVAVEGPIMAGGRGGGFKSSSCALPYCGLGVDGVESQSSAVVMMWYRLVVMVSPVRCGLADKSSHSS